MPTWLRLMRPIQWTKNGVVLAGVIFSSQFADVELLTRSLLAFASFCIVSSAMYVFNDWHDRGEDRLHPVKRFRPIASGEIAAERAIGLAIALIGAGLMIAAVISTQLMLVVMAYSLLMICYTLWLRDIVLLDVVVIAMGFVLRALAGTVAVDVSISLWLFVCTLLLALTLGVGKREGELHVLRGRAATHRSTLAGYERLDLPRLLFVFGLATVSAYVMYTIAVPAYGRAMPMLVTAPFVALGVGRYLWLAIREHRGSTPEKLLFQDKPLIVAIGAWVISVAVVLGS
ncbi:MAG TPA: decaprenyl-phosphate phosphoribosyltransferase [Thermomicrobiales bacterium]|nr:decaprenyl-phosphate phosphoribosyltransferase [Thermomicrobiales bacterium]